MANNNSYLNYEGLQTLVSQIKEKFAPKSVVSNLEKTDASLALTDGSLDTHIKDGVRHITAEERTKWNAAADTAAGSVSKNEYDAKVADIDSSIAGIKTTLADKADKASTLGGYGITDAYTKTEVEDKISALGSVFSFKGTKDTFDELNQLTTDNKTGDVWHVKEKSAEYVWDGTKWEELGSTVDLNSYATEAYVNAKFTNADASFAGTAAKATMAENSDKLGGIDADKYAQLTDITLKGVKVNGTALAIDSGKNVDVTVAEGTANGTIAVNGANVSVHGLGSAAYTESSDYATAAQGELAASAIQQADLIAALDASLAPYAKSADVANTYATKAELKTLNDASTSYEKIANKVNDITGTVADAETKYPTVKAVKDAIEAGIDAGDTRVMQTAITTGESPILVAGTETSGTSAEAKYAADVKIDAATGTLTATTFKGGLIGDVTGNLSGIATLAQEATKATQDASGNVITATYATKTEVANRFTDPDGSFAGTAANATKAADSDKLGGADASEYAKKADLEAQMVTPITTEEVEALFANA